MEQQHCHPRTENALRQQNTLLQNTKECLSNPSPKHKGMSLQSTERTGTMLTNKETFFFPDITK